MNGLLLTLVLLVVGVDWPPFASGVRLSDLFAVPLFLLTALELARSRPRFHGLDAFVVVYLLSALPSFLATSDIQASGLELGREIYLVGLYVAAAAVVRRGRLALPGVALAAGATAISALSLAVAVLLVVAPELDAPAFGQRMELPYLGPVLRLTGLTRSPVMLGCLLTAAIPFAVILTFEGLGRSTSRRWGCAALAMSGAVLLTVSHAMAGFLVAAVAAAWPFLARRRGLRTLAVALGVVAVLAVNVALAVSVRSVAVGRVAVEDGAGYHYGVESGELAVGGAQVRYEVMSYFRLKQIAVAAFLSRPGTGVGLDRFHEVSEEAFLEGRLPEHYRAIDPHSTLPGRLAETGIAGGLALVALLVAAVLLGRRRARGDGASALAARGALAGLLGLIVSGVHVDIMNFRFLWVLLGSLRGLDELSTRQRSQGSRTSDRSIEESDGIPARPMETTSSA